MTRLPKQPAAAPTRIALALVPGCLDASLGITLTLVATANALCRAQGRPDASFQLSLVGTKGGTSTSAAGLRIAHEPLVVARNADLLLFPGAFVENAQAMHTWVTQPALQPWLDVVAERQALARPMAASCAGTWVLAQAGALNERQATTVWWLGAAFRERYPRVSLDIERMVVSDGPVVTAGAALAHTDLLLHLVARTAGAPVAERCARLLMADLREVQSRHVSLAWMAEADPLMRLACRWIDKHLADAIDVAALAQALHLTPRTLARRCVQALGLSPWRLVQRRRVEAAADLLRTTTLPFEKVAAKVGYNDPSALRALIRRELGIAPSALRG